MADNGIGKPTQHRIAIQVEFAPIITVSKHNLRQSLYNNIDISCDVEAYPSPAIVWMNNQVQLSNNQYFRLVFTYLIVEGLKIIILLLCTYFFVLHIEYMN